MAILTRRRALIGALAMPAVIGSISKAKAGTVLKISHQFPGGTVEKGDFRDRLVRIFAKAVEERTNGALAFEIYADSSLMKADAQFSALRKNALDLSLYPLAYAGGEIHACNLGLMPCLVTSYEQGAAWKQGDIGRSLAKILEGKGVQILSWIWQAGGAASRSIAIAHPVDIKGVKIRGGSREMDLMFSAAGGQTLSMPSNEIYISMKTGTLDAAVTSSTSLISFHLEELAKTLTVAHNGSFWFMFEPLLMSKARFDSLPAEQRSVLLETGADVERWGMAAARGDDVAVGEMYQAKGVFVGDFSAEDLAAWRRIAEESAWKDFSSKSTEASELLKLAQKG